MGYSKLTYEEYIEHPEQWGTELPLWAKELSEMGYPGVSAIDFYDDIFGEDLEEERLPEEYVRGEYAGIAIERVKKLDKNGCVVLDKKGKEMELTLTVGEKTQDALPQTDSTQSSQDNSQQQQQDGQQYGYSYGQGGFPFNFFN